MKYRDKEGRGRGLEKNTERDRLKTEREIFDEVQKEKESYRERQSKIKRK